MISVIVAVYQAEDYIHRCLKSILTQTFGDFELILIDDGSTDKSGEICDEYAKSDSRVSVIHKSNEGLTAARQDGLNLANGEYLIYCDPDDWIDSTLLESLTEEAYRGDYDMVICDMVYEYKDRSVLLCQAPPQMTLKSLREQLYFPIAVSLCNKLIRKECFQRYKFSFPKGLCYAEDMYAMLNLCSKPIRFSHCGNVYYHYDRYSNKISLTGGSVTLEQKIKNVQEFFENMDESVRQAVDKCKIDLLREAYEKKTYSISELRRIFPSVNFKILMKGMKHPISCRDFVELGCALYGMNRIGKIYNRLLSVIADIIRGRRS